jgi:hypothetical protein
MMAARYLVEPKSQKHIVFDEGLQAKQKSIVD